jgi:oligoendopeptidase F
LSDAEEKILADAAPLAGSPSNFYGILTNADFAYPTITLSDGRTAKVDQGGLQRAAHVQEPGGSQVSECLRSLRPWATSAAPSGRR